MRIPEKAPSDKELTKLISGDNYNEYLPHVKLANLEYLPWDELRFDNRFKGMDLKILWSYIRLSRQLNARLIQIDNLTLSYVQTPSIEQRLHELDFKVGGRIGLTGQIPEPSLQRKYLVNSVMEEAIASSQLEGATTSRLIAKQMLRENRKPRTNDERMILNAYLTMNYIRENTAKNQKLSPDLIKNIHKIITKDTLESPAAEGAFRTDNEIRVYARDDPSTPIYEPPDFKRINGLIDRVCEFVNSENKEYYFHPIIKGIILHYLMGYVHPFEDGNGRTARALFYWYLISQNYDFFEYIPLSRAIKNAPANYARAYLYAEQDNNDITYFIKFNLEALDNAVQSFINYAEKVKAENRKILETIQKNPMLNMRQADILMTLNKSGRAITITEVQERYRITYQTARSDLLNLATQGYLKKQTKNRAFIFFLDKPNLT